VLPEIADDGYRIADHIVEVLQQTEFQHTPLGVLTYNPSIFSPHSPGFTEARFFPERGTPPLRPAHLDQSFYAKWREMSPEEAFTLLVHSYDEMRTTGVGTIRDRAFGRLWRDIQEGRLHHWAGGVRHYNSSLRTAVGKNYRNFLFHLGWCESDGGLTKAGLEALHVGTLYGANSRPFLDTTARAALSDGKHLILFNAISEYQDSLGSPFPDEQCGLLDWSGFWRIKAAKT